MNMANMEGCSLLLWKVVKGLRKEQGSCGLVSNNTKKTSRGLSDPELILLELFSGLFTLQRKKSTAFHTGVNAHCNEEKSKA